MPLSIPFLSLTDNDDFAAVVADFATAIFPGSGLVDSGGGIDVVLLPFVTFRGTVLRGIGRAALVVLNILLFVPPPAPPLPEEFALGDISFTNLVFFDDDGSIMGGRLGLGRFLGIAVIDVVFIVLGMRRHEQPRTQKVCVCCPSP